jgi:hypothetical protein
VAGGDGLILIGGTNGTALQPTVWKALLDKSGALGAWTAQAPLPTGIAEAAAALGGNHVYVYGGRDAKGPVGLVLRGNVGTTTANLGQIVSWDIGGSSTNLPVARAKASGFSANGVLYLVGGADSSGPQGQLYWTAPDAKGDIPGWQTLTQTNLPLGLQGASAVVVGSEVFLVGGTSTGGPVSGVARANLAPQAPFFQLGLFGVTVPALKIGGEVGQQLGYLNAAGVGTVDFVLLLLVGYAFAHKEKTAAFFRRLRGRDRS